MDEAFLHFVWKYQQFNKIDLTTADGRKINILKPGFHNTDAGPDFKDASIRIEDITWNGNVEIHVTSDDWPKHAHHKDAAYDNVILHVVWQHKTPALRSDGSEVPVLELRHLIKPSMFQTYENLLKNQPTILCEEFLPQVNEISVIGMRDRAIATRLNNKSQKILNELELTGNDWEETTYRLLAVNFGLRINSMPFYNLARSIPLKIVKKHADNLFQVEALLFGQSGFLNEESVDEYHQKLKSEYDFLKRKYDLSQVTEAHHWKFLRLRPANFPTIRIAQYAALLGRHPHLFSLLRDMSTVKELSKALKVKQSDYWQKHYHFGKEAKSPLSGIGQSSINLILINTLVPVLYAHGLSKDEDEYSEKALSLLQELKAEQNHIISEWQLINQKIASAYDSQACIEIYNSFCKRKRCLECAIGVSIVNKGC